MRSAGIPSDRGARDGYGSGAWRFEMPPDEKALLLYAKTSLVRNMSLGGVLAELNNGVRTEGEFPMALFFPDEVAPVKFKGRAASFTAKQGNRPNLVGIEFLCMAEHDRSRVNSFLTLIEEKKRTASPSS